MLRPISKIKSLAYFSFIRAFPAWFLRCLKDKIDASVLKLLYHRFRDDLVTRRVSFEVALFLLRKPTCPNSCFRSASEWLPSGLHRSGATTGSYQSSPATNLLSLLGKASDIGLVPAEPTIRPLCCRSKSATSKRVSEEENSPPFFLAYAAGFQ